MNANDPTTHDIVVAFDAELAVVRAEMKTMARRIQELERRVTTANATAKQRAARIQALEKALNTRPSSRSGNETQ